MSQRQAPFKDCSHLRCSERRLLHQHDPALAQLKLTLLYLHLGVWVSGGTCWARSKLLMMSWSLTVSVPADHSMRMLKSSATTTWHVYITETSIYEVSSMNEELVYSHRAMSVATIVACGADNSSLQCDLWSIVIHRSRRYRMYDVRFSSNFEWLSQRFPFKCSLQIEQVKHMHTFNLVCIVTSSFRIPFTTTLPKHLAKLIVCFREPAVSV